MDWLLDKQSAELALPRQGLYVADTEDWHARVECVSLGAYGEIYLNDILARRTVQVLPMENPSDASAVGHVALAGGVTIEPHDSRGIAVDKEISALYRRVHPHVHVFEARTRVRSVAYRIDCAKLAQVFDGDPPPALRALLDGRPSASKPLRAPSTELLRSVARQMLMPGVHGGLRRLLMEGLMAQLLVLQVTAAGHVPARRPGGLTHRQRAAVHEARERLLADLRHPPSLGELAAAVNLTEKKLNAGFRELFSGTAFEILRNDRLDHARQALEEEALTLKEAAFRTGYDHVSNFVHAFRNRFGMPPRQYLDTVAKEPGSSS